VSAFSIVPADPVIPILCRSGVRRARGCPPVLHVVGAVVGVEALCLFMGTCFAYDNPSVSPVATGKSVASRMVVALDAVRVVVLGGDGGGVLLLPPLQLCFIFW
jgi:hypothetical protein